MQMQPINQTDLKTTHPFYLCRTFIVWILLQPENLRQKGCRNCSIQQTVLQIPFFFPTNKYVKRTVFCAQILAYTVHVERDMFKSVMQSGVSMASRDQLDYCSHFRSSVCAQLASN